MIVFIAVLGVSGSARGQAVGTLHSFTGGQYPTSSLVEDSVSNFYGTTAGTIYKSTAAGAITPLHTFGNSVTYAGSTVADGADARGNLILASDGFLYGTTTDGGIGYGVVYKISKLGVYSLVHRFVDPGQGAHPEAGVIQGKDGNFYGTAMTGGAGQGVVFRLKPDGTYDIIHSFSATNDATSPTLGLVKDTAGNLYGATATGGTAGYGAIYKIDPQFNYSIIYNFPAPSYTFTLNSGYAANSLGGYSPNSALTVGADGGLHGIAVGANYGAGGIYKVTPQGQFTMLHYFGDGSVARDGAVYPPPALNYISQATAPLSADHLVLGSDGNFYGATYAGGAKQKGVLFKMTPDGQLTILHSFGDGSTTTDGAKPIGLMQTPTGNFYGTATTGGSAGYGTLFKVTTTLPGFASSLQVTSAVGSAFSYQVIATQGTTTYSASGLPTGLTINSTTGIISGSLATSGTTNVTLTAKNSSGSSTAVLVINAETLPVISSLLNYTCSTSGLNYTVRATQTPVSFGAAGLPSGVRIDPATGVFLGTPTTVGTYFVNVMATNAIGGSSAILTLNVLAAPPTSSQEYVALHSFGDGSVSGEGAFPGPMILGVDGTFFGVTTQGGSNGGGTVFNLSASGSARVIANLGGSYGSAPQGLLQTADGTLYGTALSGGSAGKGAIFKLTPAGVISVVHTFGLGNVTNDGANPQGGLILGPDGNFYGTTQYGGSANLGTVFRVTPAGVVTIVHSFGDGTVTHDGAQPVAALVNFPGQSNTMYGTTLRGGAQDVGTLFSITTGGTCVVHHSFGDPNTTNDGQLPHAALTVSQLTIYGTTTTGGSLGKGTVFSFSFSSTMTILHSFGDGTVANDGQNPIAPVVIAPASGSGVTTVLYGTTQNGGTAGNGTVFECDSSNPGPTGTTTILHNFGDSAFTNDGTIPMSGIGFGPDGNLYGTTMGGGTGYGTAYGIAINQSNANLIVATATWAYTGTLPAGMAIEPATGQLSGVPAKTDAVGNYTIAISQYSGTTVESTQNLTLKLDQTYASWASSFSSRIVSSPNDGPDGITNLLKYFFDIDPGQATTAADHAAMPALSTVTPVGSADTYLTLTFREFIGATGVTATLQSSTDMQTWTDVPVADLLSQQVGIDGTTGDPIMEMGKKITGPGNVFLRLNVTLN